MTNVAQVRGLVLQDSQSGHNPKCVKCATASGDSVAIAVGDVVKLSGGSDARGRPTVAQLAAGSAGTGQTPYGVVVGVEPVLNTLFNHYRLASTTTAVFVCVDPAAEYIVNVNGTGLTNAMVGSVFNVKVSAINTTFGRSGFELDSADTSTSSDATLPLRLLGIVNDPLNVDLASGAVTNSRAIVKLNGTSASYAGQVGA